MVLRQNTSRLNLSHEIFVWVAPPEPRVREARVFGDVPKIMKLWNLVPKFPISSGNTEGTVMDEEPPDVSVERCALRRGEDVLIALEEGVQLSEGLQYGQDVPVPLRRLIREVVEYVGNDGDQVPMYNSNRFSATHKLLRQLSC